MGRLGERTRAQPSRWAKFIGWSAAICAAAACAGSESQNSKPSDDDTEIGGFEDASIGSAKPTEAGASTQPIPHKRTEVVLFEDSVIHGSTLPELVYRKEGAITVERVPSPSRGIMRLSKGTGSIVHPGTYRGGQLFLRANVTSFGWSIRVAHLGMTTISGVANPNPGIEVRFLEKKIEIVSLKTNTVLETHPVFYPKGEFELSVDWSVEKGSVRVDLPGNQSFTTKGHTLAVGGFAIATTTAAADISISRVKAVWPDDRPVVVYDGLNSIYEATGSNLIATIPGVATPAGQGYYTASIDPIHERSLIVLVDSAGHRKGYAVRNLRSGAIEIVSGPDGTCNGLDLSQGATSFDGVGLYSNPGHIVMTWFRWDAYNERRLNALCTQDSHIGFGNMDVPTSNFKIYADPAVAFDGSMVRYVEIDSSWRGVTHLSVAPELRPYISWNDRALPGPRNTNASHTGTAGSLGFAVRDLDRLIYEEWAYVRYWEPSGGSNLHLQSLGFNVFTGVTDWAGPARGWQKGLPTTTDWANIYATYTRPGTMYGYLYEFDDAISGAGRFKEFNELQFAPATFTKKKSLPFGEAFEMLYQP